ncbi:MAG: sigma-70 family RNA polymerase sigma factor [Puniceicoccales bacterium]|jgi:RNA polymerase sigma factor for flagellar operon FliA|nr:sigma-70 family RNA polymerase sigma factor [Puniceicoccales bacterium]
MFKKFEEGNKKSMNVLYKDPQKRKPLQKVYTQMGLMEPDWGLVMSYLPLLKSMVGKVLLHCSTTMDRENIYTVGLLGLISATQTFKREARCSFGSYASIRIKGALLDELRRLDWLPRGLRLKVKNFQYKVVQLEQKFGRPLSNEEICNYLHVDRTYGERIKQYAKPIVYVPLDIVHGGDEDDNYPLQEVLADVSQDNGREIFEKKEMWQILRKCLEELPRFSQQLLSLYYVENLRLSEIAKVFQLSESRICQIHSEVIAKLRKRLSAFLQR